MPRQVNDRYVNKCTAVESSSLNEWTLQITLAAQPEPLRVCTQQYRSDHCLPAKASSDICCHSVVSQSLSFSATFPKAFCEPIVSHQEGK